MENRENQNPAEQESDISKAQSRRQPADQAGEQPETSEQRGQQPELGQPQQSDRADEGLQGETATQQRTDIEGGSLQSEEEGEVESGFVSSKGERDTSSELVDKQDLDKGEAGAPEGK